MTVPAELLREHLAQPFSQAFLGQLAQTAGVLPALSTRQAVCIFVFVRVCREVADYMDSVQPIDLARHTQIEMTLRPELSIVATALAEYRGISDDQIARLIKASELVRLEL